MTPTSLVPRGRRSLSTLVVVAFLALFAALGLQTAAASKSAPAVPPPPTQPTRADQIQNVDQVKTAIKAYYDDTATAKVDPVSTDGADKLLHEPSATGAYAQEMAGIERTASSYLADPKHGHGSFDGTGKPAPATPGTKAILLDVDDTSLNTYSYEIYSSFVFNPATNGAFVDAAVFPGVPGMADLATAAQDSGYTVFFLTGRPEAQRPGTEQNLTEQGFPVKTEQVFLKDESQPWITCDDKDANGNPVENDGKCSTIERKSQTRRHIEQDLGYDIVANFGDQFSDLTGGFADRTFKLPNPMYFLP